MEVVNAGVLKFGIRSTVNVNVLGSSTVLLTKDGAMSRVLVSAVSLNPSMVVLGPIYLLGCFKCPTGRFGTTISANVSAQTPLPLFLVILPGSGLSPIAVVTVRAE